MNRHFSTFVIALIALLGAVPKVVNANTIVTLPDTYQIFDMGGFGGNIYAGGRINGGGAAPLLYNNTTSSTVNISVPQYNGRAAVSATVTSIDSQTGQAWLTINYGSGITRTGSVSVAGGAVTLNQFSGTGQGGNTFVNAAAGGYGFGTNSDGNPIAAQPGGVWASLSNFGGAIWDAVFGNGNSTAVGSVGNSAGGTNAAVFTNLTLTLERDCGTSLCSLQSVSSDATWGGLQIDLQIGLMNLHTGQEYMLPGQNNQIRGVLGGANPVLFYLSQSGPRAFTLGGTDQDYSSWVSTVLLMNLGYIPKDVGDARIIANQIAQSVPGSTHYLTAGDPTSPGNDSNVPEGPTWAMLSLGLWLLSRLRGSNLRPC